MVTDPDDPQGWHQCHLCGTDVDKDGYENTAPTKRHFLSDCRPDLVEHELTEKGTNCTWPWHDDMPETWNFNHNRPSCYAYQDLDGKWTEDHIHFYTDGPM